jgi:cytoskeletal protein CcmA (bactofilin family)
MEILAEFLDFDRTTGTVKLKGHVKVKQDFTVDGTSNFVSEVYCGNNLTVSGDADFKGNVKSKGTMVGSELDNPTA